MPKPNGPKRRKVTRRQVERTIYLVLIVLLALYGLRDSGAAVSLIGAVKEAFLLLFNLTP
jgi:hypothetical protein